MKIGFLLTALALMLAQRANGSLIMNAGDVYTLEFDRSQLALVDLEPSGASGSLFVHFKTLAGVGGIQMFENNTQQSPICVSALAQGFCGELNVWQDLQGVVRVRCLAEQQR